MTTREQQLIRFGPFEVDLHTGELFKNGLKLKLQPQPILVLGVLLEKPGELVTREEFRERLWTADTFVDFEHSLNTAVKKLRQALGDEAETPLYIETLPRRGYRFVGRSEDSNPSQDSSTPASVATQPPPATTKENEQRTSPSLWRWVIPATALLVLALFGVVYLTKSPSTIKIAGTRRLTQTPYKKAMPGVGVILTDGARIYFREYRGGGWGISQVSTMGGEVPVLSGGEKSSLQFLADISPDSSRLLLQETKYGEPCCQFWLAPVPMGPARRIPITSSGWAIFTLDGDGLLYSAHRDKDLYRADLNGDHSRRLMTLPDITCPRVSPDGQRLRFTVMPDTKTVPSIWEVGMDGNNLHPLFADQRAPTFCGVWSPDGKLYAFHRWDGIRWNLWVARNHGNWLGGRPSEPVQLTFGPISYQASTFSRDSKALYSLGVDARGELAAYTPTLESTPFLRGISASFVAFSADHNRVAYVTYPEGSLWRSRTDGSERMQLSFPPMVAMLPRWSPDGKLIVFAGVSKVMDSYDGTGRIYLVPADGGIPLLLPASCVNDATWSPDGSAIACGGCMKAACPEPSAVKVFDLNTQKSRTIPGSEDFYSPRWSPDGKHLVALAGDIRSLWLYTFADNSWVKLASGNPLIGWPEWSQDSRYVYVDSGGEDGSNEDILRIDISNQHAELVLSVKDIPRTGRWANWFALTPDNKILLLRNTGSEDLYALDLQGR
jgi:DNA-binding winged helix-turn-helix (wHTH) protein/Tol biopolymer transport system component